ncbi:MAG: DUF3149 domain-containing protein [Zoogloeaceae bacterium]|jgi:hypothetical protein|nr:DUF3149 domain-containing protein [Zoogloeaceae bacterium]
MLQELLSNEIGLLSVFTIGFVIVMAIFLPIFFSKKINEDAQNDRK